MAEIASASDALAPWAIKNETSEVNVMREAQVTQKILFIVILQSPQRHSSMCIGTCLV